MTLVMNSLYEETKQTTTYSLRDQKLLLTRFDHLPHCLCLALIIYILFYNSPFYLQQQQKKKLEEFFLSVISVSLMSLRPVMELI